MHPVKRARLEQGLSLTELAARSGVNRHTIRFVEDGRPAQARTVARLARALGLAVDMVTGEVPACEQRVG